MSVPGVTLEMLYMLLACYHLEGTVAHSGGRGEGGTRIHRTQVSPTNRLSDY